MGTALREQLDWLEQAREAVFCRDYGRPHMASRFPGESRLSQPFFDSIVRQPVPIGLNCLHALRRSSPGLDPYLWLADRTFPVTDPLALNWAQVYARHGPFPEKAGDNLTIRNRREKVSPGTQENQARLVRTEIPDRAMAAHLHLHAVADPRRPRVRRLRLSVRPMPPLSCPASLLVTAVASSLSHSLACPILRSGLGLPPVARLELGPLLSLIHI